MGHNHPVWLVQKWLVRNKSWPATWMLAVIFIASVAALGAFPAHAFAQDGPDTLAPMPAAVINGNFECPDGYYIDPQGRRVPVGWQLVRFEGEPLINSARHQFAGSCEREGVHVERIEGRDAILIEARDLETPPLPGKPYDVVLAQQVIVAPGGDYSISGWMLSLCGGSAVPSDCPPGVFIRKAIGLDPLGGLDPDADTIVWTENLHNFVTPDQQRIGWSNLRVGARAAGHTMTVFLRIHSPFQWHGSHAFIDAVHLVRSPVAWFVDLPATAPPGTPLHVRWSAYQSPEIDQIPGGTHQLLVDVQTRTLTANAGDATEAPWQDLAIGADAPGECWVVLGATGSRQEFRVRARAEQPPPPAPGAWPNQRFPGVWSTPRIVRVRNQPAPAEFLPAGAMSASPALYVPTLGRGQNGC